MSPTDEARLERVVALRDLEIEMRRFARRLEYANVTADDPLVRAIVERLYRQANGHRKARMALLERSELC